MSAIHRVESDPGEDAYGAPTKVGPMSQAAVEKLMREAEGKEASPTSGVQSSCDASLPVLFDAPHPSETPIVNAEKIVSEVRVRMGAPRVQAAYLAVGSLGGTRNRTMR